MNKWYEQEAKDADIIISSRIRLARNLANYPFSKHMTKEQKQKLNQEIKDALEKLNLGENHFDYIDFQSISNYEAQTLAETHIISPDFLKDADGKMLVLSQDHSISIMVNEEDHIRIQVLKNGLNLSKALEEANKIDDAADESLSYAFDDQLGFLTACPSNLGTGLRASVMLHIPALEKLGAVDKFANTISKLGLTIRGTYGEGTKAKGAVYQISNQITLGISEKQAVNNLTEVVLQIVEKEREARKSLVSNDSYIDKIYRSYGILKYAKMISTEEFFDLMSYLKIGISEQVLQEKITAADLNRLLFHIGSAAICFREQRELPPMERDKIRARMIQENL